MPNETRNSNSAGSVVLLTLAGSVGLIVTGCLASPPLRADVDAKKKTLDGFQLQKLDEPLKPFKPLKPRSPKEQKRVDALAHFMVGQRQEQRGDFDAAAKSYRKAIELDPKAIAVYRSLIPLAFVLNQTDDAIKLTKEAVKLNPDDYAVLYKLGAYLAGQGKISEAVKLFEQALESKSLKENGPAYIKLMGFLAYIYGETGKKEQSADAYKIVFDALVDPAKYKLDFRTQAELLADRKTAYERIGQAFLNANRPELAIQAFERADKSGRGKPGNLNFNLASVYRQTKQFEKALEQLQKYFDLQLQSKGRAAYELLKELLKETDRSKELVERLEGLAKLDRRNNTLQFFLAEQYITADRLDAAETLYKKVLKDSREMEGYVGLATVYRRQNRPEELIGALSQVIRQSRGRTTPQAMQKFASEMQEIIRNEKLLESLFQAGRILSDGEKPKLDFAGGWILAKLAVAAKKTSVAVEFYKFTLSQQKSRVVLLVYKELENLGRQHLIADKFGEAIAILQMTVDHAAEDALLRRASSPSLFWLSHAYELQGDTDKALASIKKARTIIPDNVLFHFQEGWVFYHARQWDKAAPLFEEVIAKYSGKNDPDAKKVVRDSKFSLSNLYVQKGDIKKGEEILEKILVEEPDNPSVNNDLGYLYADQGKNLEQAEKMIRKAVKAKPEQPAYLDSLGWVLYKLGKYDEAVGHLQKAVELPSGSDATIWDHLGDCYNQLKKIDEAKKAWQKALELAQKKSPADQKIIDRLKEKLADKKQSAD